MKRSALYTIWACGAFLLGFSVGYIGHAVYDREQRRESKEKFSVQEVVRIDPFIDELNEQTRELREDTEKIKKNIEKIRKEREEMEELEKLKDRFAKAMDMDGDGKVSNEEIRRALREMGHDEEDVNEVDHRYQIDIYPTEKGDHFKLYGCPPQPIEGDANEIRKFVKESEEFSQ